MDKIRCRLKMLRRGSSTTESRVSLSPGPGVDAPTTTRTAAAVPVTPSLHTSDSSASLTSLTRIVPEATERGNAKLRWQDLGPFCDQLDHLLEYIHSLPDLNHLIYGCPSTHQQRLEANATELQLLHAEVRAALLRLEQIRNQRKAVRKECRDVLKTLSTIKDDEIKEMENFISLYDKSMLARWEKIRSSPQKDVVESLLHDIKGKQQALNHLHSLASHKLAQLQSNSQPHSTEEVKPVSLALRRMSGSGCARSTAARWRGKHHERVQRASTSSSNQESSSLPLVPLMPVPFSLLLGPTNGSKSTADSSVISSTNALGSASSSFIPSRTDCNTAITSPATPIPTPPERRSMLQALFSGVHHPGRAGRSSLAHTQDNLRSPRVSPQQQTNRTEPESHDIELYDISSPGS